MSRPTVTQLAAPSQVRVQSGATVRPLVTADLNVRTAPSGAELLANSLGIALGNVQPAIQRAITDHSEEELRAGQVAGSINSVDAERARKSKDYARGASWAANKARVAAAAEAWETEATQNGYNDLDPDEYAAAQEDFMRRNFAFVLEDEQAAKDIGGDLIKFVQTSRAAQAEQSLKRDEEKALGDFGTVVGSAVDAADRALPEQRAAAVAERDATLAVARSNLRRTVGGTRANDQFAQMVINEAIRTADVSLLAVLENPSTDPETGATLAPLAGVPRIGVMVRSARQQVENEAERRSNHASTMKNRDAERALFVGISLGQVGEQSIVDAVATGHITPDEGRTYMSFLESRRGITQRGDIDIDEVAALERDIVVNGLSPAAVLERSRAIGYGEQGLRETTRLVALATARRNAEDNMPASVKVWRDAMKRRVAPTKDIMGNESLEDIASQARAIQRFDEAVQSGRDPEEAFNEIAEKHSKAAPKPAANTDDVDSRVRGFNQGQPVQVTADDIERSGLTIEEKIAANRRLQGKQ